MFTTRFSYGFECLAPRRNKWYLYSIIFIYYLQFFSKSNVLKNIWVVNVIGLLIWSVKYKTILLNTPLAILQIFQWPALVIWNAARISLGDTTLLLTDDE